MSPRGNGVGVVPHPMLLFFLFTLIANTTTTNGYEKEGSSMKKSGPSAKLEEWFGSAPQESAVLLEEGDPVLEEEEGAMIGQTEEDDHVHEPTFFLYDSSQSFPKIAYHGGSKELSLQQLRSSEHQLGTNDEDEEDWEPSSESGRKHARSTRNDNNKELRTKKRKNLKKKTKKKKKKKKKTKRNKKTPAVVPDKASESEKDRIEQRIEIFGRKNLPTEALLNPPTGYSYKVPDVDELDCEEGVVKAYVSFDSLYSTPSFTIDHRGGGSAADSRQSRDSTTASSSSPSSSSYSLPSRVYVPKQIWQTPPQFDDKMYRLSASHDFIIWADGEGRVSELYYQESNELTLRSHFNKTSSAQTKLLSLIVTSSPRYRVVGIDSEGRFLARCFRTESTIDCTALGNNLLAGSPTSTTSSSTKSTSNRRRRRSTSSRERRSSGSSSSSSSSSPKAADSSSSSSSSSSNKRRRKRKKKSMAKVKNTKAARDYSSSSSSSSHSTTSKSGSRRRRNKWRSTRDEDEDGGGDGLARSSASDGDAVDDEEEGADGNHHTATVEEGEEGGEGGEEKHGRKKQHSYFWLDLGSAMPSYSFKGVVVVSLDSQRFFLLTKTGHLVSMETDKRMASWKTWPPPPGDVSLEIIADAQVATPRGVFVISADGSLWQLQIDGNDDDDDDDDDDDGDGDGDDDDGDDSDEEDDNDNAWEMRQQTANRWICHYHPEETGPLALMEALAVQRGDSGSLFLVTRSGVLVEWRVKEANGGITKRKKQKKDSNNANKRTTKRRSTRQKKMKKKKMKRRRRKKKNKMTSPPHPTTATAQKHKVKARRASDSSSSGRWIVHGIPDASDKGTRLATSPVAYSNEGSFYLFMISEDGSMQEYQIGLYASGSRSSGSNEDDDHTNESSPPSRWITHEATKVPLAHMRGAISRKSLWFFRQDGFIIESQIVREEGGGERRRGQGGAHGSISSKRRVKSSASSSSPNGHSRSSKHLSPPPSSSGRDGLTTTITNSIVAVTSGQCTRIKSKWDCLVRNQEGEIVPSSPPSDAAATDIEIEES